MTHGRPPARPPPPGSSAGSGAVEHERLAQREVQVHRAGAALERGPVRAAGELAQPAQRAPGVAGVVVDLAGTTWPALAVELDLVDRLPGADVAQLRRPVGGEHEQRHARLVRLDHGRRVVGRRGARRARERDRQPARLRQRRARRSRRSARRCATSRAAAVAHEREHERRGARARRRARLAHAAARELVDERAQVQVGVGRCHRSRAMPADLVLLHGFTQTGRSWQPVRRRARGTLPRARARPPRPRRRSPTRRPASFAACDAYLRALSRRAVHARRLLDGRPDRAARRARARRARRAGSCSSARARGSPTRPSATARAARPTRRSPTGSRRSGSRRSCASGARSRCSPACRAGSRSSPTPTGCATRRAGSPRRCAGSARA